MGIVWREYDAELLLCRSSSLNPDGSDSAFVGAGEGGVWRSMFPFAVFGFRNGVGEASRRELDDSSSGERARMKVDAGACSSNILRAPVPWRVVSGCALLEDAAPRTSLSDESQTAEVLLLLT